MSARFQRYECPLCDWKHDEPFLDISPDALASVFGTGMMQVVGANQQAQRVEEALRKHFATHTTEQWLTKVTRLQKECDALRALLTGNAP